MSDGGIQYWQEVGQWEQHKEIEMGRFVSDSGGTEFEQAPPGNHLARCIRLVDLGTQHGEYQGKPNAMQKVVITWELPEERMNDGQPFMVSAFFTQSLSEKANLRALLESWRGRSFSPEELAGFDLNNVLNAPCMLSVIHNDKKKARVSSAAALPKGMKCPPAINEVFSYWIAEHNDAVYAKIGKGLHAMIEASDEWKLLKNGKGTTPIQGIQDMDDDVPFADPYKGRASYAVS